MERDLRLISKQRAEKDRANGIIENPSPLKETDETIPNDATDQPDAMLIDIPERSPGPLEGASEKAPEPTSEGLNEGDLTATDDANQETLITDQQMPQDSENSMGLAITIPSDDVIKDLEQPKTPEKPSNSVPPNDAAIEMPETVDLDFESMFNDTDPKAIDDTLNFDFGLSTDPPMTQDIPNDNSFNDINMDNIDMTNIPATTNEDIDSLLPGVENYLDTDIDFSNISIPPATAIPETSQSTVLDTTVVSAPPTATTEPAAADTSFEDNFFGLGSFEMGETGGDELGDGTLEDFENFDWS